MPTKAFKTLDARLLQLKADMLPAIATTDLNLTQQDIDQTSAFLLLAGAEIEQYLEDCCSGVLNRAQSEWQSRRKLTRVGRSVVLAHMLKKDWTDGGGVHFWGGAFSLQVHKGVFAAQMQDIEKLVNSSFQSYSARIRNNNGFKDFNLRSLVYALGIFENKIDGVLASSLASFSGWRGSVAHLGIAAARSLPHPSTIATDLATLMNEIRRFDVHFSRRS